MLIKRRRLIQFGAGASVLAPFTRQLLRDAEAALPPAKRLLVLTAGCGFHRVHYRRDPVSETEFELGGVYASFEAKYRNKLTVLERFYNPFDLALHGNAWALLTMRPTTKPDNNPEFRRPNPGGPSIDRFVASQIGKGDPFDSIAMGFQEYGNAGALCTSASGVDQPFPAKPTPLDAYNAYFGDLDPSKEFTPEQRLARDRSLLDAVRGESARIRTQLGAQEQRKLDQFETSLRELEGQLAKIYTAPAQCGGVARPGPELGKYSAAVTEEACNAFADVAANAFLCARTHVAHLSILGFEAPHRPFPWLTGNLDQHTMGASHNNDMESMGKIAQFILSLMPRIMDRLAAVPEGSGTMADNTLMMYLNGCGGHDHGGQFWHSVVMLGDAGGAIKAGRYLRYKGGPAYPKLAGGDPDASPGITKGKVDPNQHSLGDVYVAVARAMGIDIETFGAPEHCKGPLPGLLARG